MTSDNRVLLIGMALLFALSAAPTCRPSTGGQQESEVKEKTDPTTVLARYVEDDFETDAEREAFLRSLWADVPGDKKIESLLEIVDSTSPLATTAMGVIAAAAPKEGAKAALEILDRDAFKGHPLTLSILLFHGMDDAGKLLELGQKLLESKFRHARLAGHGLLSLLTMWPVFPHPHFTNPGDDVSTEAIAIWSKLSPGKWSTTQLVKEAIRLGWQVTATGDKQRDQEIFNFQIKLLKVLSTRLRKDDPAARAELHRLFNAKDDKDRNALLEKVPSDLSLGDLRAVWTIAAFI